MGRHESFFLEPVLGEPLFQRRAKDVKKAGGAAPGETDLRAKLLEAYRSGDDAAVRDVKTAYEAAWPNEREGIEALFGFLPFLQLSKQCSEDPPKQEKERRAAFNELTEYQFLIAHFIIANHGGPRFLGNFRAALEALATKMGARERAVTLWHGIITQVATFRLFQKLGRDPKLSHPREDAFDAIDLWNGKEAVQIKSDREEMALVPTGEISFPAVRVEHPDSTMHVSARRFHDLQHFRAGLGRYAQATKENITGYLMIIPRTEIDMTTGEPSDRLVNFMKAELDKFERGRTDRLKMAA